MNQIIKRISLKSPKFFVKVQNFGLALTGFAVGIKALAVQFEDSRIIDIILPYTTDIAVAGAIAALVAKMTVKPEIPNRALDGKE